MSIDYDQLLAKRPASPDSIFAWHQDMAYWPPLEFDPATCTCWLAIDDSTVANGQGWGCPTVRTLPTRLSSIVSPLSTCLKSDFFSRVEPKPR